LKIFINIASIKKIKEAASLGIIDGVTTNPTLVSKEMRPTRELLKEISSK